MLDVTNVTVAGLIFIEALISMASHEHEKYLFPFSSWHNKLHLNSCHHLKYLFLLHANNVMVNILDVSIIPFKRLIDYIYGPFWSQQYLIHTNTVKSLV